LPSSLCASQTATQLWPPLADRGGDTNDDRRLAHFVGVSVDDVELYIDDVAVADAVVAGVVRAAEGNAEVAAAASTTAASLKATYGLGCSKVP